MGGTEEGHVHPRQSAGRQQRLPGVPAESGGSRGLDQTEGEEGGKDGGMMMMMMMASVFCLAGGDD